MAVNRSKILCIEPFYGGSHKQLIDTLVRAHPEDICVIYQSPKKWHWRARCSALQVSEKIPLLPNCRTLFCSSVLSLAELLGLRPDLQKLKKIVYFHENQMVYPKQDVKERDYQYGYNELTTCLAADIILFNSLYNQDSFLGSVNEFIKMMPDCRPTSVKSKIQPKCRVLHFPLNFDNVLLTSQGHSDVLHIIWPHRWEFDKNPEDFFRVLFKLKENKLDFKVSVLGETFETVHCIFEKAQQELKDNILYWGYIESKQKYFEILCTGHVVVSTAWHEFYGVSMLEATYCGCFPLVPNRLVYPEIYDKCCLYNTNDDLYNKLTEMCVIPELALEKRKSLSLNFNLYSTTTLIPQFTALLT